MVKPFYFSTIHTINAIIPITSNTATRKARGIHSGEVTHHQDHAIVPVSFSIKNTTNRTDGNPILLDVFVPAII